MTVTTKLIQPCLSMQSTLPHAPSATVPLPLAVTPRPFFLPPEILSQIILSVPSAAQDHSENEPHVSHVARNSQLAPLARLNRAFQEAVYSEIYTDMRIIWTSGTVSILRESFRTNPALLPLVRRLEVIAMGFSKWRDERVWAAMNGDENPTEEYFQDYYGDNGVESERRAEPTLMWGGGILPGAVEEQWEAHLCEEAVGAWTAAGHSKWDSLSGAAILGAHELLDLLKDAPNVQTLVLRGFEGAVLDDLTIGPYPSLHSIEAPASHPFGPDPPSLASLLVSRTPALRRLCGTLSDTHESFQLPPLTHLDLHQTLMSETDSPLLQVLLQTEPSLQVLRITPRLDPDWATSAGPFLSLLDSFTLCAHFHSRTSLPIVFDSVVRALATSTSIRHLGLELPHDDWCRESGGKEETWSILEGIRSLLEARRAKGEQGPLRIELALGRREDQDVRLLKAKLGPVGWLVEEFPFVSVAFVSWGSLEALARI